MAFSFTETAQRCLWDHPWLCMNRHVLKMWLVFIVAVMHHVLKNKDTHVSVISILLKGRRNAGPLFKSTPPKWAARWEEQIPGGSKYMEDLHLLQVARQKHRKFSWGCGDGLVGSMLARQAWGPEFESQNPHVPVTFLCQFDTVYSHLRRKSQFRDCQMRLACGLVVGCCPDYELMQEGQAHCEWHHSWGRWLWAV